MCLVKLNSFVPVQHGDYSVISSRNIGKFAMQDEFFIHQGSIWPTLLQNLIQSLFNHARSDIIPGRVSACDVCVLKGNALFNLQDAPCDLSPKLTKHICQSRYILSTKHICQSRYIETNSFEIGNVEELKAWCTIIIGCDIQWYALISVYFNICTCNNLEW